MPAVEMRTAEEILDLPYRRVVIPDGEGRFFAEIPEFPGCIATGDSAFQAYENLEVAALSWIDVCKARNLPIPEPVREPDYSGKLALRMPKSLHQKAASCAQREGVSLNQFIVGCITQEVTQRASTDAFTLALSAIAKTAVGVASASNVSSQHWKHVMNIHVAEKERGYMTASSLFAPGNSLVVPSTEGMRMIEVKANA